MSVLAFRDLSFATEALSQLRNIVESTTFRCRVLVQTHLRVGLIRIEYDGHSEEEVRECDLKLTAKVITAFEARGAKSLTLFPLEIA